MHIAFITVGDTARLTGGYLYHARVFAILRERGLLIDEIVAATAGVDQQAARAAAFGAEFDPAHYDAVVVDALARTVCAEHLDRWRAIRPLVAMVHELPSVASGDPSAAADEQALLRADLLIAVSRHGAGLLTARGVAEARIRIVSPGRDRLLGHSMRYPNEPSIVLAVAQWIPRKGIHTLVAAWRLRRGGPAVLELIGETSANPAYTAQVLAAIGNDPSIRVRGAVSDAELAAAYGQAALFALPSRYEGYGMVYAEALHHGLPVVACATGPLPELLGDAALLVPPDNPAALAA
ncbi:MAG: glycosyltransferase, partial [Roseiflexaceae bacterium]|nr:glycosyltransferase [Roseiflexaceae bacterium]